MSDFIFSADSHIIEPPKMWAERIEAKYRDRAPQVVSDVDGKKGEYYVFDTLKPIPITRMIGAGYLRDLDKWREFETKGFEAAQPSTWDPSLRLTEQDEDGVHGEVLFPTYGMVILAAKDEELKAACFRAVNSYLADYCSVDSNRLAGVGCVSIYDPEQGIKDMQNGVKMGLKGFLVTGSPGEGGYGAPRYDKFWAAAAEMDIPITMHDLQARGEVAFIGGIMTFFLLPMEIQAALGNMILTGVFDRHPKLKVISAENDVGWLPHFVHRLEHYCKNIRTTECPIKRMPSEIVSSNIWASTQFESAGIMEYVSKLVGSDRIMWGSDYPHPDSTYPNTRQWINDNFSSLNPVDRANILGKNVSKIYNVDVDKILRENAAKIAAQ